MDLDTSISAWLASSGYATDNPMEEHIARWKSWIECTDPFYDDEQVSEDGKTTFKVDRISIKPAKLVAAEWTALLIDEKLHVTSDQESAQSIIDDELSADGYLLRKCVEWVNNACSLGTAAMVMRPENVKTFIGQPTGSGEIKVDVYTADSFLPLDYDSDGCTAAAFLSTLIIKGKQYTRVALHHPDDKGDYVIENQLFSDGKPVTIEGVTPKIPTRQKMPTFTLFRPSIQNTYVPSSCMGVSVIDDATAACRILDEAVNSTWRDLYLSEKMLILPENYFRRDDDGQLLIPRKRGAQVFRTVRGVGDDQKPYEFNPEIRIEENRNAVKLGLELLGWRTGLGRSYWSFTDDSRGSNPTTATEVVSSNSDLYRNQNHHQTDLRQALSKFIRGYLSMCKSKIGWSVPDDYELEIDFGDNVIDDETTKYNRLRDLFNAAGLATWELRAYVLGESDEEAKTACDEITAASNTYGLTEE